MPDETRSLMRRLREQTAEHHRRAEFGELEQWLLHGRAPLELYIAWLEQRFLIHRTLETLLRKLVQRDPRFASAVREELFQEHNLREDLTHFGRDPGRVVPLPATLALLERMEREAHHRPPALLGVHYVFEGSKNGARFLARSLSAAYGLENGHGLRYLDPHGEAQRSLWQQFKVAMDAITFAPAEEEAIVEAAQWTFDAVMQLDTEIAAAPRHCGA